MSSPYDPPKIIGIIGGVGPLAGLDLAAKIVGNTRADKDQEHLPFVLASRPEVIPDRTAFLLGLSPLNPAGGLIEVLHELKAAGVSLVGIPCNTAHAAPIFGPVRDAAEKLGLELLNMLEETAVWLGSRPKRSRVAVLSTLGTYQCGVYRDYLDADGLELVDPGLEAMEKVHEAIYHPEFGIKSRPDRDFEKARQQLEEVLALCREKGAELAVLGCTELPLVFEGREEAAGLKLADPTTILARALIRRVDPSRLSDRR